MGSVWEGPVLGASVLGYVFEWPGMIFVVVTLVLEASVLVDEFEASVLSCGMEASL